METKKQLRKRIAELEGEYTKGFNEALALVLEALEIKGYEGALAARRAYTVVRFREDLKTAVAVRAERREQEERERTEKRVRNILHPDYEKNIVDGMKAGDVTESRFPTATEASEVTVTNTISADRIAAGPHHVKEATE